MIVVDTSALVGFFRGDGSDAAKAVRRLEIEGIPYAIPGVCCQELLAGARDRGEWDLLAGYLETQHLLSTEDPWRTHSEAASIMFDCRQRGMTLRGAIDCLIAQMTLEVDGALLHSDRDFDRIAEVRPLRTWRY